MRISAGRHRQQWHLWHLVTKGTGVHTHTFVFGPFYVEVKR